MFVISGSYFGQPAELKYEDGKLEDHPANPGGVQGVAWYVRQEAEFALSVGPCGGPLLDGFSVLTSEVHCWLWLNRLLSNVELIGGEMPAAPAVPDGAIP